VGYHWSVGGGAILGYGAIMAGRDTESAARPESPAYDSHHQTQRKKKKKNGCELSFRTNTPLDGVPRGSGIRKKSRSS